MGTGKSQVHLLFFTSSVHFTDILWLRPRNYKELYNLRHSQLRNAIERIFGIAKRRFKLLNSAPEYPFSTQAKLVPALGAVHNYIRVKDPADYARGIRSPRAERRISRTIRNRDMEDMEEDGELGDRISLAERKRAMEKRDQIAKAMWDDYIAYTS